MFQIRELEMVHWDFWQAIKVPLDAQIVTVVGPNGSGKTTLLDALRTLLGLKCSGRRDYKRYVRNNKENIAWLRCVVSNPRREAGGLFPTLFFPATADEITLFCRIKKQGGDWVRQYAIADGRIELVPGTESLLNWIGVNEYRRRLESAGLTPAIAEVLALEQGDTDKLCEYSPKTLLDLVFQVFGDKQVLDYYQEAKLRLTEAEDELGKMEQQASQLGLDVERLKLRANNHLEWRTLQENAVRLESRVVPALRYVEQWGTLRGQHDQWRGAHRVLRERLQALATLDVGYRELETSLAGSRDVERAAQAENDAAYAEFQAARDAARDTEKLLQEADRLRRLAEAEDGADAVALNDKLAALKDEEGAVRLAIKQAKIERQTLTDTQTMLQSGRAPQPDFVRNMRAALDQASIPHQLLTEIVEVRDPQWQEAVEALLGPSRHIILLNRSSDKQRAWELAQQLRYRHFIVPDREPVPRARTNSMLEVVDFNADVPDWLAGLLNRTQRADSVAHGQKLDGDWITRDAFHKERRGARDISVRSSDYAFGEGARQSRSVDAIRRLREINDALLADEARLVALTRDISSIQQALMGMQAVVQLAARQDEFAAAAARFHDEQTRLQDAGARLAAAQSAWQGLRDAREEQRIAYETQRRQREQLEQQIAELREQLTRQRDDLGKQLRSLRAARQQLPAEYVAAEHLQRLAAKYDTVKDVQREIDRIRFLLDNQEWEADETILARRDKLAADYAGIERDTDQHRRDVVRTRELTDDARAAYINKLRATVRAYGRNVKRLGELAGIDVELDTPHLENDDTVLAQAGLTARFNFDQKGMMGLNDGEASGGQQVMKSLILLIGLMMDDANTSGFVFIDEPFAHLDIFNIDRVGGFLKATQAQYLITTPLTHNTNVYGPSELTLTTRKKQPGQTWAPLIMQTRRRIAERALETATGV
ncbi:hypothetical protein JHS3_22380 [Jeongeupia sp. HS-3]|uniref:AAA family ATPase n=1 Tax=Jeongeupia sp. HS-3 TaxID=1009682 RepID=UPI0018A68F8E|nr:AAA family ATPase [Jeongeupia sp. HS-3]BCL76502.1 hypothetical protein JHS3_22380 [Jeongeupia sp. HS-3]